MRKQELRDKQKMERDHLLFTTERLIRARRENLSFLKDELELVKEKYKHYKDSLDQLEPLCHAKPRKPRDISVLLREFIGKRKEFQRTTIRNDFPLREWSDDNFESRSSQSLGSLELSENGDTD